MLPGIMSGSGGGNSITSPSSSSLDVKQSFENHLGGNAGVSFGASQQTSQVFAVVAAVAALAFGLSWLKKKRA
jgi:lipoprotein signal peptidase